MLYVRKPSIAKKDAVPQKFWQAKCQTSCRKLTGEKTLFAMVWEGTGQKDLREEAQSEGKKTAMRVGRRRTEKRILGIKTMQK